MTCVKVGALAGRGRVTRGRCCIDASTLLDSAADSARTERQG